MERTKGKFEISKSSYYETIDIVADDVVCSLWRLDEETHDRCQYDNDEANAKFIVRACNNFDGLLDALNACVNELRRRQIMSIPYHKAIEAISQAEAE